MKRLTVAESGKPLLVSSVTVSSFGARTIAYFPWAAHSRTCLSSRDKTTFCLSIIAEAQRRGGLAAFVDVEHALDPRYARVVGVNLDDLLVSQPDSGEDALNITETLIRSNAM